MKTNNQDDEAPLGRLLREWKVGAPLPPRFNDDVWRRIEGHETAPASTTSLAAVLMNWIATLLPRPRLAFAYVAVLVAIGAGLGWGQARQESARVTSSLASRYVQSVDPYQSNP